MNHKHSAVLMCLLIAAGVATTTAIHVAAQESAANRPDLSGRWQLNRGLSDDAREKVQSMSGGSGDAGGGGHSGPGRGSHGGGGGGQASHAELEKVILDAPIGFVLTQDDEKVVLTEPDGVVRTLPTDNRKVKVNGRDVRTRWENGRLVSESTVGDAKVVEMYERAPTAAQLVVTVRLGMGGRRVTVRRVYDAVTN